MVVTDDWVAAAMTDDEMVVELLIRLKHGGTVMADNPPPLRWGTRRRRSRSSRFGGGCGGGVFVPLTKKYLDSARASPKTPLSWSGVSGSRGGSVSPSADGFEDACGQVSCSTSTGSGSKVFPTNEITGSFSKRLKKNKSSSELKKEENLKLKERIDIQKEIASLKATFDEQNLRNQRLKKIKLGLNSSNKKPVNLIRESKSCKVEGRTGESENQRSFFLPDLNMVPSEAEIFFYNLS